MVTDFLAFLGVACVVIVVPGQDTALTIRNTLTGGRGAGMLTAAGVACGQAVWAVATSIGVVGVLLASEAAFTVLRLAGAAYLVLLGLEALAGAVRGRSWDTGSRARPGGAAPVRGFRQGVLSNLGNPKMAVFFTSLLPQFVPAGEASFAGLLLLGLVFCAMTLVWLSAYAVAVASAGEVLARTGVRRVLDTVTGAVLVALGLRLAGDERT